MDESKKRIIISGGLPLNGEVNVSGAKNAAVAIIPASLLSGGVCVIENLPYIEDVTSLVDTLEKIGATCEFLDKHRLRIDSSGVDKNCKASYESVKKMRASYYLLGALLGRFKRANIAVPGGCNFGDRPINMHIKAFETLGANVSVEHGMILANAEKLTGTTVYLDIISVGTTINIMLAATLAEGMTIIENAAKEPHVVDTANFLNAMGAKVKGAGTDTIKIMGVKGLHGAEYMIIPDQIEAGTYMIGAAATGGDVLVKNVIPKHMDSLSHKLMEMGVTVEEYDDSIRVCADKALSAVNVKTMPYPGFPTDLQPPMTALLSSVPGSSILTENIYENRYQYVNQLRRLGASIEVEGRVAVIEGIPKLTGAEVSATDLRAGAALIVAGLISEGKTIIGNVKYIQRGYEEIVEKLHGLGASVELVEDYSGDPDTSSETELYSAEVG